MMPPDRIGSDGITRLHCMQGCRRCESSRTLSRFEYEVEFRIWTDALHNGCIERLRLLFENVAVRIDILLLRLVREDVVHHVEGVDLLRSETQRTVLFHDYTVLGMVVSDEFELWYRYIKGVVTRFFNDDILALESQLRVKRVLNELRTLRSRNLHAEEMALVLPRNDSGNTQSQQGYFFCTLHRMDDLRVGSPFFSQ